ncbi:alpha/beta fold hydrolase [Pseudonocardia endophytica]|uniref:alpha/beta fold hydrolase n=1 Tax=Pseudonocardia endophytica TaxID=401976 RepID=UPI001FB39266|nr:alpha/beta hydrolase [Pseudonocardia endophytica]
METREIELSGGRIRYHEEGDGPPVLFVHGLLVHSGLWRDVVPGVARAGFRCVAPDWPMGAHTIPVPDADLSPPGVAAMIAEFCERTDLDDVTVVANDTGGAITQILMANHPERIGRVVLTPSDSFEHFLPPMFNYLTTLARVPCAVDVLAAALRPRVFHRLPMTFGWLSKRPVDATPFLTPSRDPAVRADLRRFLTGLHRRHTLAAVDGLRRFPKPVLLAWASEDRLFPMSLAHRLADVLPDATVVEVDDSYTFVPLDRPERLTELVVDFARARTSS